MSDLIAVNEAGHALFDSLFRVSVHEAGHAVVASLLRVGIEYVTTGEAPEGHDPLPPGSAGACVLSPQPLRAWRRGAGDRIIVALAGPAAEGKHAGQDLSFHEALERAGLVAPTNKRRPWASDFEDALVRSHSVQWRTEFSIVESWAKAKEGVALAWPAIEAVANGLLFGDGLTGHQVRSLVRRALGKERYRLLR